jgi:hypothetical protein
MFRIGSALFIPAYLSVIAYRVLGDRGGDAGIWPLMLREFVACRSVFANMSLVLALST